MPARGPHSPGGRPWLRRLRGVFADFGFRAGLLYLVSRGLGALSPRLGLHVYEFMAQPVPATSLLPPRLGSRLSFREIAPGDPALGRMPLRPGVLEARFAQGAICLGAYQSDDLLAYLWLCFQAYDEDEVRCTYLLPDPAAAVFDFDVYVLPERRMGIGFMAAWEGANRYLRERGVRYSFSRVSRFNEISRRSHARLGSRPVGRAVFLQLWGAEFMAATVPPYLGVTFRPSGRPRLRLPWPVPR